MENLTAETVWAVVGGILAAIVLIVNAGEKIAKVVGSLRAPNAAQDQRLAKLEAQQAKTDDYLRQDKERLERIEKSNAVTQRALLALLGHGLHGNNVEQMQASESELQRHLIDR